MSEFIYKPKIVGRKRLYVVFNLFEGRNSFSAMPITRRRGQTEIRDIHAGTFGLEDIFAETGNIWTEEQIIQGLQNYYGEKEISQRTLRVLNENSQKPPMILTR